MISCLDGARLLSQNWLNVKPSENTLIITNEGNIQEAFALFHAVEELEGIPSICIIPTERINGQEPPTPITEAMLKSDVIIAATKFSIATTQARINSIKVGARMLSVAMHSSVGKSVLESDMLTIDLEKVSITVVKVASLLAEGNLIRVTSEKGTDLTIPILGRKGNGLNGICYKAGTFRSLSIEANIAPLEGKSYGKVALDGSLCTDGLIQNCFTVILENGKIINFGEGLDSKRFQNALKLINDDKMLFLGEFGIGLNPKAQCIGDSYIEDESALGTIHLGFGRNLSLGGEMNAKGHYDVVILRPTIYVDDILLMSNGEIVF